MKYFATMILTISMLSVNYAQAYPRWFLHQGKLNCESSAVGYSTSGYYHDSSTTAAFNNSTINIAQNSFCNVKGGQGFWTTEIGSIWMGKDITLSFDTALANYYKQVLEVKDSYSTNRLHIVLSLEKNCELSMRENELISLRSVAVPNWIENIPDNNEYYFASGEASSYYYESSSWLEAEKNARINLAKQIAVEIQVLEKFMDSEGQSISKEEVSISLYDIKVVARWVDVNKNIFYVLVKMSKT